MSPSPEPPFSLADLVETKNNARVDQESTEDKRPVIEENAFDEKNALRDEDERRRDRGYIRLGTSVVDQPALVIICDRDHRPADDKRRAPNGLRIPKSRRARQPVVREERAADNEYHARQYFPIYFFHAFIIRYTP